MARPKKFDEERKVVTIRLEVSIFDKLSAYCESAGLSMSDFFARQAVVFNNLCDERKNALSEIDALAKENGIGAEEAQTAIIADYLNYKEKYPNTHKFIL